MRGTFEFEVERAARLSGLIRSAQLELAAAREGSADLEEALARLSGDGPSDEVRAALDDIFDFAPIGRTERSSTEGFTTVPAGMRV